MQGQWYVYVLRGGSKGWFYIGLTNDVQRRLGEHNRGYSRSTKGKGPFVLLHVEAFADRPRARLREKELKSSKGRRWLKATYG